jgi:MGT family glycosyltransferase
MTRRRFLFAMWEGGGTVPPELAVASRLVARGHDVRVLGDPSIASDAASAGAHFLPWRDAPHRATRTAESEIVRDWQALTPLGAFARARDRHAFRPASLFAREVRHAFEQETADVVVVDAMLFGALVGAEATGARVAALLPMTSFLPAPGRPPSSLGLSPARGLAGRLRDRALQSAGDAWLWRSCLSHLNDARREMALEPVAHPLDQLRRVDRVLVQTSAWFDFDAPVARENVRYVGPELADPAWASGAPIAESSTPLVLVGFSTTFMGQRAIVERIVAALATLPVRAIVTTGPALDPKSFRAPPNVTVCASASHAEILPRAALVVTHGGHGTVIRALAAGVPIVTMPMGRDQSDNAVRVSRIGAGITVSRHARTRTLRRVIDCAAFDAGLHRAARRARDVITREFSGDPAVEELEKLASRQ